MYNENLDYALNEHIQQGIQFKNYGKKYYEDNEHKLLEESSSPTWGSIVEAFNGDNSVKQQNTVPAVTVMSADQTKFNNLVSDYATSHNTYTSAILLDKLSDDDRLAMEEDIAARYADLIQSGEQIQTNNNALMSTNMNIRNKISENQSDLKNKLINLNQHRMNEEQINKKYDKTTLAGVIETTELNMNSMYYHYLVYFIISITLIAFTFNILVNPNANVLNAIVVVGAIIMVYLITRHYAL
jgi:hypothetical protein